MDFATGSPVFDWVAKKISDYDKNALEEGVRVKETHGGTLTAVIGGDKEAAREALAMGADEARIFSAGTDHLGTARILAGIIRGMKPDLIILAEASVDEYSFQTGPRLAEELKLPLITYAKKLDINDGFVTAERDLERVTEKVRAPLPAVVTVTKAINEPRIPTLLQILGAGKKKTAEASVEAQPRGVEAVSVKAIEMKRKAVMVKEVPELATRIISETR